MQNQWHGIAVTWNLGPKMNRQDIRRTIGNSYSLIIFDENEQGEPFDPLNLYLGKVTNYVLVIRPVKTESGYSYRIGQFLHYEQRWEIESDPEKIIPMLEKKINGMKVGPLLPKNFLVNSANVRTLIMVMLHNAVAAAFEHHSQMNRLITVPLNFQIEQLISKFSL